MDRRENMANVVRNSVRSIAWNETRDQSLANRIGEAIHVQMMAGLIQFIVDGEVIERVVERERERRASELEH